MHGDLFCFENLLHLYVGKPVI